MIDTSKFKAGMTRAEIRALFGEPSNTANLTRRERRKKLLPQVWRYGRIELAFSGGHPDSGLWYVMDIGESGQEHDFLPI